MNELVKRVKTPNPKQSANPLSIVTYAYMFPIFFKNYKTEFTESELFEPLTDHKAATLGNKLESVWKDLNGKYKKTALHRALFKIFRLEFAVIGFFQLLNELILIAIVPFAIRKFVGYFENENSSTDVYIYASTITISLVLNGIIVHYAYLSMQHFGMKLRLACSSLIYRKALRLSQPALMKTTIGQLVNLLSNDVGKFEENFVLCHYMWISLVQVIIGVFLLYQEVEVSAFAGILFLLSFSPLQFWLGKRASVLRLRAALRTDERVRLMNEIISGIQVIKMYTWEKPFAKLISASRRKEIKAIRSRLYLLSISYSCEIFLTRTAIFITIMSYVLLGKVITAEKAFAVTAIYNVLKRVSTVILPLSITSVAEVNVSIMRLQKFLSLEETQHTQSEQIEKMENSLSNGTMSSNDNRKTSKLVLENVTAKWENESTDDTLIGINLDIRKNQLVAVVGPVGSGKSSLFNVILRELPITSGRLDVEGRVSYAAQEPWLFSASIRQNILFGNDFNEKRYREVIKVCALEADFASFHYGDLTLIAEKGKTLSGGQKARVSLARCIYRQADIYLLDDPLSAVDANVGKYLYDECIKKFLKNKICVLITHQLQYLRNANHIVILKEGKLLVQGKYEDLENSGHDFVTLLEEFNSHEEHDDTKKVLSRKSSIIVEEKAVDKPEEIEEEVITGNIKLSVYWQYLRAGGGFLSLFVLVSSFVCAQVFANGGDYFVAYWMNLEQTTEKIPRDNIVYIYAGITAGTIIMGFFHTLFFFMFLMRSSVNIYDFVFAKISHATMRFFNTTSIGRILNRFSKDMGLIDEHVPPIFYEVCLIALLLIGTIVLISIVNPWLILPSVVLFMIFYLIKIVYLATSRNVKRIEAITRSPVYGHASASIHGLTTIRACSAQNILSKEFDQHQDQHSSAWFLYIVSSRAFGFWMDMICSLFITVVTFSLIFLNKGYFGGDIGLIITQLLGLSGSLPWGMFQWTELENSMTSVERVFEYTKVETEPDRDGQVPKVWPSSGKIQLCDVSMKYNNNEPNVLHNLNYSINSHEKVGVVGRTGAGKSSTITALFQLYEIEGSLLIDDVDTTKIPLHVLRSNISIIPQEPVLFSGTIRKNLDPFDEYNDDVLWYALEQVEMKDVIAELPAGLSSRVCEGGSNFSVGQRQLMCLARAVVRNTKILVMDEATANVDPQTDALIQHTIRKNFKDCTVLTIAHRLHTIMDSDRVLVMDGGTVVEFDHAHVLLQNKGAFYNLVQTTGTTTAKNLQIIAEEDFTKKKNA